MEGTSNMNTEESSNPDLMRDLRRHLEDWNVVGAMEVMSRDSHTPWLAEHAWETVPLVAEYLTPENEDAGPHLTQCCQDLLLVAAEKGNAKENLIAFLEQIDGFGSEMKVRRCLPGLSVVLSKIKDKSKALSWSWALSTLYAQVKLMDVPENTGMEGEERLAVDLGEVAVEATEMIADLVTFAEPLVALVGIEEGPESEDQEYIDVSRRRKVLRHFLLQLLGHPLTFLNLHPEQKTAPPKTQRDRLLGPQETDSQPAIEPANFNSARKIVKMITEVTPNVLAQVTGMDQISSSGGGVLEEEEQLQDTSIGTFLYLVLGEGLEAESVPSVYTKLHLLHTSAPHICTLIKNQHEMCVHKGLLLLNSLLKSIPNGSVGPKQSDNPTHLSLIKPLVHVCVYHDIREMRTLAFECYRMFISIFSIKGRYKVFRYIFNSVEHSGILGWTITQLKEAVKCSVSRSQDSSWNHAVLHDLDDLDEFRGDSFVRLVKGFLVLKNEEKTDLLDIYDESIAKINMFEYVLKVDKNNLTGVKDLMGDLNKYVGQLDEALRLSRAHYRLKLSEIGNKTKDVDCNVVVGGRELPDMPESEQKSVIDGALTTFDMLQYNLVRLTELLKNSK